MFLRIVMSVMLLFFSAVAFADGMPESLSGSAFDRLDVFMKFAVADKNISGAVVLVGHNNDIVFEKAYGRKGFDSEAGPMTIDTLFDISSLTKVIATVPSLMILMDRGRLRLEEPLSECLPADGKKAHAKITLRQLLTHYSGLPANLSSRARGVTQRRKPSPGMLLSRIYSVSVEAPPGREFIYSDLGYILLGKVIEHASGQRLDAFVSQQILSPLMMRDSMYRPGKSIQRRIAPSEKEKGGAILRGYVQDPTAGLLDGIAGNSGLFSTAHDLGRFARMILNGGELDGRRILKKETVHLMTSQQSPSGAADVRGLGWDIQSRYSSLKSIYFSNESFGHTGYTGSSVWIDPVSKTYVIVLTNRENLSDNKAILELRTTVSNMVGVIYAPVVEKAL
jgi:CubicO group peptidase (beta-lactamase class C family)